MYGCLDMSSTYEYRLIKRQLEVGCRFHCHADVRSRQFIFTVWSCECLAVLRDTNNVSMRGVATALKSQLTSYGRQQHPPKSPKSSRRQTLRRVRLANKATTGSKGPGQTRGFIGEVVQCIGVATTGPRATIYERAPQ